MGTEGIRSRNGRRQRRDVHGSLGSVLSQLIFLMQKPHKCPSGANLCQLEREGSYIMLYNALSFALADYERFRPLSRLFSGYKPLQPACFSCDALSR
jgi:hypothetical protein